MRLAKINDVYINPSKVVIIELKLGGIMAGRIGIEMSNSDIIFVDSIKQSPIAKPTIEQVSDYIDECLNFDR
jgi:hypothetical protein